MNLYIYKIQWSVADNAQIVAVYASNSRAADLKINRQFPNCPNIDFIGNPDITIQ